MKVPWGRIGRHASVLAAGIAVGAFGVAVFVAKPMMEVMNHLLLMQGDHEAYVAYRYGSYELARRRIFEQIRMARRYVLENGNAAGGGSPTAVALWYGRLGASAERAGALQEAEEFFRAGVQECPVRDRGFNVTKLREFVQTMDADWDKRLGVPGR